MSNSIVGNNGNPTDCLAWHEVEIGDDEYEDMEGEIVDEEDMFGYRAICPKNTNSTTVTIFFYYYAPTSEWYWDWMYGLDYKPVIPVVYAADSNWNLTQCLNSSLSEISLTGQSNGWKSFNITLTRKLMEGERIFFGLYSDLFGYTATGEIENAQTTMCYFYWTRARRNNYASQIAYLSSPDFLSQQRNIFSDYEICIYLQYENEPDSIAYTRTVLGNIGVVTANSRRMNWKRTISGLWNISSRHSRKTVWKRNSASNGFLSAGAFRSNHLFRAANDSKCFSDFSAKKLFFYRKLEDLKNITALNYRSNRMNIEKSDGFSFSDSLQQLLLLIRSVFSSSDTLDNYSHKANYKRMPESIIDDEEMVVRSGDNLRSFLDEIDFEALPFASRLFFRTVQSIASFWDWLRGKIREANNVVTFFCPIDLEITMECRI